MNTLMGNDDLKTKIGFQDLDLKIQNGEKLEIPCQNPFRLMALSLRGIQVSAVVSSTYLVEF